MSKISVLDKLLKSLFDHDDKKVLDPIAFASGLDHLFSKRIIIEDVKNYFKMGATSGRILAFLVYTQKGRDLIVDLVEKQSMPVALLYSALLYDGTSWMKLNADFPMHDIIVQGGDKWDFDPATLFWQIDSMTLFPGALEAMVERLRRQNKIDDVIRHMPINSIIDTLENRPGVYFNEVNQLNKSDTESLNEDEFYKGLATLLMMTYLPRDQAIAKHLGSLI